ncbi:hypothetical protein T11_3060 [Trichinella zimbabwensis]|uniref:Uncharacterized protein n=1 Tax=Trichinella zimbabwensis TaxID=268475 RepID=A0A0V1HX45_9BILA|nr:hypothetical protein T11_3060 [Trichinella zimbabwensis]
MELLGPACTAGSARYPGADLSFYRLPPNLRGHLITRRRDCLRKRPLFTEQPANPSLSIGSSLTPTTVVRCPNAAIVISRAVGPQYCCPDRALRTLTRSVLRRRGRRHSVRNNEFSLN